MLFAALVAMIMLARTTLLYISGIASSSMIPAYDVGDQIVSNQLAWGLNIPFIDRQVIQWQQPQRGDVVIFKNPYDNGNIWMKRVIGLPGDHIEFKDHQLWVNGMLCTQDNRRYEKMPLQDGDSTEQYRIWHSWLEKDWGPVVVPDNEMFLIGDNRGTSLDSRTWGSISMRYLFGQPVATIWPLSLSD